jgi:hypothetical protein
MKKIKIIMIWAILAFLFQETNVIYHVGYESLIEYATENAESREECVYRQTTQAETKKSVIKKENHRFQHEASTSLPSALATISVNRTILYRTLLI